MIMNSCKTSQHNSRKNSVVLGKDQFWQTLKTNLVSKPINLNKSIGK